MSVCHIEIPSPDLDANIDFYLKVFPWHIDTQVIEEGYVHFRAGDMSGGFDQSLRPSADGVCVVIHVEDIVETLGEIVEAGGSVIQEKTELKANQGSYAYFADPCGNRLGLFQDRLVRQG